MAYTNPSETSAYTQTTPLTGTTAEPVVIANTDTYGADTYARVLTVASTTTLTSATVISGGTTVLGATNNAVGGASAYDIVIGNGGLVSAMTNNYGASQNLLLSRGTIMAGGTLTCGNRIVLSDCVIQSGGVWNMANVTILAGHNTVIDPGATVSARLGTDFFVDNGTVKGMNLTGQFTIRDIDVSGGTVGNGGQLYMYGSNIEVRDINVITGGKILWEVQSNTLAGEHTNISKGAITRFGANAEVVDGVASNFAISNNWAFTFGDGITLKDATITSGATVIASGAKMVGGTVNLTNNSVTVAVGGEAQDIYMNKGRMVVFGKIIGATVETANERLILAEGAYAENVTGLRIILQNANTTNVTIAGANTSVDSIYYEGSSLAHRYGSTAKIVNGVAQNFTLNVANHTLNLGTGITLKGAAVSNGTTNLLAGAKMDAGTITAGTVNAKGALVSGTTITGGTLNATNGAVVSGAAVGGGAVNVTGTVMRGGTITAGFVKIDAGGTADSVTVTGGVLTMGTNAIALNVNVTDGYFCLNAAAATIAGANTNISAIGTYMSDTAPAGWRFGADAKIVNGVGTGFVINNTYSIANRTWSFGDGITLDGATINYTGNVNLLAGAKLKDGSLAAGRVGVDAGATVDGTTVTGGTIVASTGALVSGAAINGGEVIASGGLVSGGTVAAEALVIRGGEARGVEVESDGKIHVSNGGVANGIVFVASGGSMVLSAGAVANDVEVQKWTTVSANSMRDYLEIQAGATVNNLRASARVYISGGGQINNLVVSGDNNNVASAMTSNVTIIGGHTEGSPASLIASNGTVLSNFEFRTGGYIFVSTGALASGITFDGTQYAIRGGTVREATQYKGTMYVSAGLGEDYTISGGTVHVLNGTFKDVTMSSGGTVNASGGTVENITLKGDKTTVGIYDGGLVSNVTIIGDPTAAQTAGNARVIMYGGVLSGATIMDNAFFSLSAGVANDLVISNGGRLTMSTGMTVNRVTISGGATGGYATIKGGVVNGVTQVGGGMAVQELNISGAALGRGSVYDAKVTGGSVTVSSGGCLVNADIAAGAIVQFTRDGAGAQVAGSRTNIAAGAFYYGKTLITGAKVENGVVTGFDTDGKEIRLSIGDDIVVKDAVLNQANARISCFDGAKVDGALVSAGAVICNAGASGTMNNVTLENAGIMNLSGTAKASNTVVKAGGQFAFHADGASAEDTTVMANGKLVLKVAANTGNRLTLDFTGAGAGAETKIDYLGRIAGSTTVFVTGAEQAVGTYYLGSGGALYDSATCGTLSGITQKWGLYENAIAANGTYDDALNGVTYSFNGTALTTTALSIATGEAAGLTGGNYTALRTNDRAAKWTGGAGATLVTENFNGDAWLEVAGDVTGAIYGAAVDFANTVNVNAKSGTIRNLAAGAEAGKTVGAVKLTFDGADLAGAGYAGGFGNVTGKTETLIANGTFAKDFYAGALANYAKTNTATSAGNIVLDIEAGEFSGNIYGAASVKAGTATTLVHNVGNVTINVTGGETKKGNQACLFAGGYATGSTASNDAVYTVNSVTATIDGGSWGSAAGGRGIFGGVMASGVEAAVTGNVNLTISGGSMGNVYGGGWAQNGGKSIVGNVNLTITGGTITNVFGGGTHSTSGGTTNAGDVTITVSGGTISGDIYARGQGQYDSTGVASVIFTGANDFGCGVWGYSRVPQTDEYSETVTGAALSFNDYTGTFGGKIGGFDGGITLNGATAMTLTTAAASDVSNAAWTFDVAERDAGLTGTALLNWSGADFTEDTITLKLGTTAPTEWSLIDAASNTAYNKFDVDGIATELVLDQAIENSGTAYDGWGFTLEDTVLKFKNLA